jgi:hypothetical protein
VQYSEPVNDPWFEAKQQNPVAYMYQPGVFKNATLYHPELPISTVGCAMQQQWCSNTSSGPDVVCTDLTGVEPSIRQARQLFRREKQRVTMERIVQTTKVVGDFSKIILSMPNSFLLMNRYGFYQMASPPDDQWIQELNHMFGTMLSSI